MVAKKRSQISGYDGHDADYGPFPTMPVFTMGSGAVDSAAQGRWVAVVVLGSG